MATDTQGNVFVTGDFSGTVAFGSTVLTSAGNNDLFVAKYVPATNTWAWAQRGGGTRYDSGSSIAVSGSSVYVAGYILNSTGNASGVTFGDGAGSPQPGATTATSYDLVVVKYQDLGSTGRYVWSQVGGGPYSDYGYGVALNGQHLYAGGIVAPPATFGPTSFAASAGSPSVAVLAHLTDATLQPLPARGIAAGASLALYPSPAPAGAAQLAGATPGTAVQVLDALGRVAATATADATGAATLGGLVPGLYLVRAGSASARLAVE